MPDVVMPRLSDSMEEGTILRWLRTDGDAVQRGDELAEIETDKATETFEAEAAGVLHIVAGEGASVPVGAVVATLSELPGGTPASPAAPATPAPAGPGIAATGTAKGDVRVEEPTRARQVVARRVAEAKATVPDLSVAVEVDMARCVELRAQLEGVLEPAPTYDDLVVRAAALALRDVPRANGAYRDGRFEVYSRVNIGVAVAVDDGLVVPTLFDADRKPLGDIARESRALEERALAGRVTPPELSGATFGVASLGRFGVGAFTAVITPPQAAVLGVGAVREAPAVRGGRVVPGHALTLTLVCDHRILLGADAALLLGRIRTLLEEPVVLAMDPERRTG